MSRARFAGLLAVAAIMMAAGRVSAQTPPPVQVHSSVSKTAIWVADRVVFTIDIACAKGVDILTDDVAKEKLRINGLEILSADSTATTDAEERTFHHLRYVLTTYRVDVAAPSIEPLSVRYYVRRPGQRLEETAPAGEISVPGAVLAFRSTLADNQTNYLLRDGRTASPASPLLARAQSIGLALIVIAVAPALLMLLATVRRGRQRTARRTVRQSRADERAALERLRSLDVATEDDRRRAYDAISALVRAHVSERAGIEAAGLTAPEIDAALAGSRGRVPRETVTGLLAACDDARYGPVGAVPPADACREAMTAAEQVLAAR